MSNRRNIKIGKIYLFIMQAKRDNELRTNVKDVIHQETYNDDKL